MPVGPLENASDALLAQRAADGDQLAFGVIVRRHVPYLRAFATRLINSSADADDAVQDALIVAWQRLPELENPERLRSWLSTIVSRKAMDRVRARKQVDELDETVPTAARTPEARAVDSSQLSALAAVLAKLPDESRQVWVLKEVGGYSYDEIADELDTSVSTVRGRLARARATVLEQMKDWR